VKFKMLIATAAVTVSAIAATGASASGLAPTDVSIKGQNGDYYGYVHSPKQQKCENNRKVNVFKVVGQSPDPHSDQKIGSDTAEPNGPDAMWSIGNSGYKHGKFYAQARKTTYCQGDLSSVISR
jgi:hypothetical protein